MGSSQGFTRLDTRAYAPGESVLLEPLTYTAADGRQVTAPRWFITDFASIPWLVRPLYNAVDHRYAGVIHDWLYCSQSMPKDEADELFAEMMRFLGSSAARAWAAHRGLTLGGGPAWRHCEGGPHARDFAWEFMAAGERIETARLMAPAGVVVAS